MNPTTAKPPTTIRRHRSGKLPPTPHFPRCETVRQTNPFKINNLQQKILQEYINCTPVHPCRSLQPTRNQHLPPARHSRAQGLHSCKAALPSPPTPFIPNDLPPCAKVQA